jgi:hypothetical protein
VRRFLEAAIGPLLDSRARRALEETLLDWSHEAALARSVLGRLFCHARAILALTRTIAAVMLWELIAIGRSTVLFRTASWLAVGFILLSVVGTGQWWQRFPVQLWDDLLLMSLAGSAFGMMPLALYLAARRSARSPTPFLGLMLASLLVMWLASDWVLPETFQHFRESAGRISGPAMILQHGPAEQSLRELATGFVSYADMKQISNRLATMFACPAFLFLAGHAGRLRTRHQRALTLTVVAGYIGQSRAAAITGLNTSVAYWDLIELWVAPLAALGCGLLLALMRQRRAVEI